MLRRNDPLERREAEKENLAGNCPKERERAAAVRTCDSNSKGVGAIGEVCSALI